MQLRFVPPTSMLKIVDGESQRVLPPTITVWLWDPDNNDFLKIHGSDISWIDGIDVVYSPEYPENDRNIFLFPVDMSKGIELDPYVRYPERFMLKSEEFSDVICEGKNSNVWIMRSPVGLHFVKGKSECCVRDMSNIIVVNCKDEQTSLTDCNCNLEGWSIHDVVNTGKTVLIYGVNTCDPVTDKIKKLLNVFCKLLFGDKGAFSDEKVVIASTLIPILGQWYIDRLVDTTEDWMIEDKVIELVHDCLTTEPPNGPGASSVMQTKELLVSLFEGVYARYYVAIKGDNALRNCICTHDKHGRLQIRLESEGKLSEVAEKYFGVKQYSEYEKAVMAAAGAGFGD